MGKSCQWVDATSNDVDGCCRDRETESNFQGEIRGSQLEGTLQDDLILVSGHDGHICYMISSKGKGKGGKGRGHEQGGGKYFEGNCSFCGTYGHKRADCNSFTKYLKGKGEKGKGKGQDWNASWNESSAKGGGKAWFTKGGIDKGKGKGFHHLGNEYPPIPQAITERQQVPSTYPQLMATSPQGGWTENSEYIGNICSVVKVKNRFQALTQEDDNKDSEDLDKRGIKNDNTYPNMNFVVGGVKLVDKKLRRRKSWRIGTSDDYTNTSDCSIDCLVEVVKEEGLNPIHNPEWVKISFMIDSGASETVASSDKFSASGTEYSSAAEGGGAITNVGEKVIEVMDVSGCMSYMKVQMCEGLHGRKMLASLSRLIQAGHRLVFDTPDCGSYIECKTTGRRRWLRQENGVFYLDLWVKPVHFGRQGAVP